jgi:cellulose synthase/poly-beta-1,6-N-acetylglucosamine synthase-like glycosyltransferase
MDFLTLVYLIYTFIAFYFLFLFILIYLQNKKQNYESPDPNKIYSLSLVIPCYNGQDTIATTISNLLKSSYPGLKKIVVVDDCSTDDSYKIAKSFEKQDSRVIVVQTPKNTGRAAGAKNYGARFADTDLIGFTDDDSFPDEDAIYKMVGFFNDKKVGAVTSRVLVKHRNNFLEKFQAIEYKVIAFTRKLLGFVDAIYVTNGPLSIYRKKAYDDVGGFDIKNLTEDIEITWHFVKNGWNVCMSIPAKVYTIVPNKIKSWFNQRLRWNVGGMQK